MVNSCSALLSLIQPIKCDFPACNCDICVKIRSENQDVDYEECCCEPEPFEQCCCEPEPVEQCCCEPEPVEQCCCAPPPPPPPVFQDDSCCCCECLRAYIDEICPPEPRYQPPSTIDEDDVVLAGIFTRFHYNLEPDNIFSVLFDVIGTLAFIMMVTFIFWVIVTIYLVSFMICLYNAPRKCQIFTAVLFILLISCITFHAIEGNKMKHQMTAQEIATARACDERCGIEFPENYIEEENEILIEEIKSEHKVCRHSDNPENSEIRESGGGDSSDYNSKLKKTDSQVFCEMCAKHFVKSKSSSIYLNDDEVRRMYNMYLISSIPMEWKSPPRIITVIVEYIQQFFSSPETPVVEDL